jgi:hypothetical protein
MLVTLVPTDAGATSETVLSGEVPEHAAATIAVAHTIVVLLNTETPPHSNYRNASEHSKGNSKPKASNVQSR